MAWRSLLSEQPAAAEVVERRGPASQLTGTQERFRRTPVVPGGRLRI